MGKTATAPISAQVQADAIGLIGEAFRAWVEEKTPETTAAWEKAKQVGSEAGLGTSEQIWNSAHWAWYTVRDIDYLVEYGRDEQPGEREDDFHGHLIGRFWG